MVGIVSGNSLGLGASSLATLGQKGVGTNTTQGRSGEQAYINVANGNLVLQRQDEYLASVGSDSAVVRTYNSQGAFDEGEWSYGLQRKRLAFQGTGAADVVVTRTDHDGAQLLYTYDATTSMYVNRDGGGAYDTLQQANGQWVWTDGETGIQEHYDATGILRSQSDANGNAITFAYNPDGLLESVTTASGESTRYDYNNGRLTRIQVLDRNGATSTRVHYGYDNAGRLATVTVDLTPSDNSTADLKKYVTTYGYEGTSKRVASVTQTDGTALSISYVEVGGEHRVASVTDGAGKTTQYAYDLAGLRTVVTDPLGAVSSYSYDASGQLTGVRTGITAARPEGLTSLTYHYDSNGNLVSMTDASGQSIGYQYDANGNQTVKTDALGNSVRSTYNAHNQLLTQTVAGIDGISLTTRYVYDSAKGRLERFRITPEGRVQEFRYDAYGQPVTTLEYSTSIYPTATLAETNVPDEAQMQSWVALQSLAGVMRTDIAYDFRGQLQTSTSYQTVDAAGNGNDPSTTHYLYGQAGELLQIVRPNQDSITQHVYDGLGRLIVSSEPSPSGGAPTTVVIDYADAARTVTTTRANGLTTLSSYNTAGRLISVSQSQAGTNLGVTRYSYDAVGRLTMTEDPTGVRQWVIYDESGRKVADVDGTGAAVEYVYNDNGQIVQTIGYARLLGAQSQEPSLATIRAQGGADDRKNWRIYDKSQRLVWQIDTQGYVTQTTYDGASRITAVTQLATPIDTALLANVAQIVAGGTAGPSQGDGRSLSAIGLQVTPSSAVQGSTVRLTAVVLGSNPAGPVNFYNGPTLVGTAAMVGGIATLELNNLPAGQLQISARYAGDASNAAAVSALANPTVLVPTQTALSVSPPTAQAGSTVTLSASIDNAGANGSIAFFHGSILLGTATAATGQASLQVTVKAPGFSTGANDLHVTYLGSPSHAGSISAAQNLNVTAASVATPGQATDTGIAAGVSYPNNPYFGDTVNFWVSMWGGNTPPTGGTLNFFSGATFLGSTTVDATGNATFATAALPLGANNVTAVYAGDAGHVGVTSSPIQITVAPVATTTALSASKAQIRQGESVSFAATVTTASGQPAQDGQVAFYNGNTLLGAVPVVNGVAVFVSPSLPTGTASVRAVYESNATAQPSTSQSAVVQVRTPLTLTATPASAGPGQTVTLTAQIPDGASTGKVTFLDGSAIVGAADVVNGVATLSLSNPTTGVHAFSASYSGDASTPAELSREAASVTVAAGLRPASLELSSALAANGSLTLHAKFAGTNLPSAGLVTFSHGGTVLGTAAIINGWASLTLANPPSGNPLLSADYAGDATYAAANVGAFLQDSIASTPALALRSSITQQGSSSSTLLLSALADGIPAGGTVTFYNGANVLGQASPVNGIATLTVDIGSGQHTLSARHDNGQGTVVNSTTSIVSVAATNTGIAAGLSYPNNPSWGETVNFWVSMWGGTAPPSGGTVSFFSDGILLGSSTVSASGNATFATSALPLGSNSITAVYSGDAGHTGITSTPISVNVAAATTNTALTASKTRTTVGEAVSWTATVLTAAGQRAQSGQVTFYNDQTALATVSVVNGTATLTYPDLPVGTASVRAVFENGSGNANSQSSTLALTVMTAPVNQSTAPAGPSGTPLPPAQIAITSASSAPAGSALAIRVTGDSPTGSVALLSNGVCIAVANLIDGTATLPTGTLPSGSHQLTISYAGDLKNASSQHSFSQNVQQASAPTSTVLSAARQNATILLTARVLGNNPVGGINFYQGGVLLGTASLVQGLASLTLSDLPDPTLPLTASYGGDATNSTSVSSTLPAAALALASSPLNLTHSSSDRVVRQVYNKDGQLLATVDGEGYLQEMRYDAAGRQLGTIRYATRIADFSDDATLQPRLQVARNTSDLSGLRPASSPSDIRSFIRYNAQAQVVASVDAEGYLTEYTYDQNGNVAQTTKYAQRVSASVNPDTASMVDLRPTTSPLDQIVRRQWNARNLLVQETAADGTVTKYSYDASGNVLFSTKAEATANSRSLASRYDAQGHVTAELSATGVALLDAGQTQAQIDAIWNQYGLKHTYDLAGRRTSTADANGNRTLYFYDADGRLTHVVNALGEVVENQYNAFDQIATTVRYGTRISLTGLTGSNAGGLINAALTSALNAARNSTVDSKDIYTYATTGTLLTHSNAQGLLAGYAYNAFREESSRTLANALSPAIHTVTAYDRRGLRTSESRDPAGLNAITTAVYDAFGRQTSATDAKGNTRSQSFDRLGRTVSQTNTLGNIDHTTYDAFSRKVSYSDALGNTTTYAYDQTARSLTITSPEGVQVKTVHDPLGQVQTVTDGRGNSTTYTYDADGHSTGIATALTSTAEQYDRAGRLVQTTDANGVKVQLAYDAANRLLTRTVDPTGLNLVTAYAYDAKGQQLSVTDPNGSVTRYTYDLQGQLTSQAVDPSGLNLVTRYTYDTQGQTLSVTDPNGSVTRYTYDAAGRRVQEQIDPAGLNLTRTYSYDKNDNVTKIVDANGNASYRGYDTENRLTHTVDGAGGVVQTVYDAAGRVSKTIAYRNAIQTTGLDSAAVFGPGPSGVAGQISQRVVRSTEDHIEYRGYNGDGWLMTSVNALGEATSYTRDANGNVLEQRRYAARLDMSGATSWTTETVLPLVADDAHDQRIRTAYDALGRSTYSMDGTGAVVRYVYDGNSNLLERTAFGQRVNANTGWLEGDFASAVSSQSQSSENIVQRYGYDKANRLLWSVDGVGAATRNAYDRNGNVIKTVRLATPVAMGSGMSTPGFIESAADAANDYVYDAANRRVYTVNALGGVSQTGYDANGNVTQQLDYAVTITPPAATTGAVFSPSIGNYTLANIRTALGGAADYQPGNRLTQYAYDAADRLVVTVNATGAVTRTDYGTNTVTTTRYAAQANMSGLTSASRPQDILARVQASSDDRTGVQVLDGARRVVLSIDAQGNATSSAYNGLGQVTSTVAHAAAANGTQAVTTPGQDRTTTFRYDAAGRLAGSTDALQRSESYTYDAHGNKASFTNKKGSLWEYQYDVAGRMVLELSPQVQVASVVNDGNGGLTVDGSQTGSVQIATQLQYDTFGNLASRTEAAGRPEARTTRYEYDALGRQTKVFLPIVGVYDASADNLVTNGQTGTASRAEAAAQLWTETRYDALGNAIAGRDATGNWSYKAYDRAGQLSYEVDAEGFVTGYTRNRWGEAESLVRYAEKNMLWTVAGSAPSAADVRTHMAGKNHAADREFQTTYDRMGRVLQVQEPQVFNYDSETGTQSLGRKTTVNSYDTFGDLVGVSKNLGDSRWSLSTNKYDQLGRLTASTDALGFVTSWSYDAAGNVLRKVEYASAQSTGATTPNTTVGDRVTDFSYDLLNRKTAEIRRGAGYSEIDPNSAWSLVERTGDLTTAYTYDAVGNLVCTTDAAGGKTYSYYDALGRVTAVVAPSANTGTGGLNNGASKVAALTEFKRDAHGNVLVSTERIAGALNATEAGFMTAVDLFKDRVSLSRFDAQGHLVQTTDALGASRHFSYNAQGQIAKEWQTVSVLNENGAQGYQTLWRAYGYDKVGRQTHTFTPLQYGPVGALSKGDTSLTYNAFGEVTQREVRDGQTLVALEKQDYDNAGRLWRSNAGDGVTKVMAYNTQGQQTIQLIASGSINLESYSGTQAALTGQYLSPEQFRRTDMRYDALGRLTQTLAPERVSDQAMSISTRESLIYGTISQSQSISQHPINTSINQVDLVWRSLQNLGSGDVRITLTYDTLPYTTVTNQDSGTTADYPATLNQKISLVVSAEEAANGYVLKWSTDDLRRLSDGRTVWSPGQPLGISAIKGIKLEKMDLFGAWTSLYDVAPPGHAQPMNWSETASPGFIWSESGDGRIPIYRYYNRISDSHYFSTSAGERDTLLNQQQGWLDEGIAGYVSASPAAGLVAMYRLTKPGLDGSVYARGSELTALTNQGWVNKGIDGYVGDPAGGTPLGMVKLYSLQHNRNATSVDGTRADGLYTTALSDRNALLGIAPPAPGVANPRTPTLYASAGGLTIEVTYPQDLVSSTTLEYRRTGSGDAWATAPTGIQRSFGSAARFDVSQLGLGNGSYEYRIRNTNPEKTREVGSGTFNIGATGPATLPVMAGVNQGTANIDGTFYRVLQWPKPSSDWTVTFRYWPKGSTSGGTERAVGSGIFSYGDGRTSGMGIGMQGIALNLGAGDFEYEVLAQKAGGAEKMHATGVLSVPQGVNAWDSTPPVTAANNNVTNLGIVGYVWTEWAPGRTPLHRYYMPYNNDHHITTADPSVIAMFEQILADQRANPSSPQYAYYDGIMGYVETAPTANNERLYQYKYGNENIYRLTANPSDIGYYQTLTSAPSSLSPGVWYQSAYQFDGYISKVPAPGTTALYAVYDGNSYGPLSQGDYLTTIYEQEVLYWYMLNASNSATAKIAGVKTSMAQIDGQVHPVLQWEKPEANARVTVTASPPLPSFGSSPSVFTQGDSHGSAFSAGGSQGIVLSTMQPGASYTISVVVEYPATAQHRAYKARTDITINVPAAGPSGAVANIDNTPAYTPPSHIVAGTPYNLTSRAISSRTYDRWNNVTSVQDPRVLDATGTQHYTTTYRYNASNQLIEQTLPQNYPEGASTIRIYYDQLGREIGVRDGVGSLNIKVYDAASNLVQKRNADGGRTDYRYDAFGDRISSAEVLNAQRTVVTNFAYDKLSRLTFTALERAITRHAVTNTEGTVQNAEGGATANGVTTQSREQTLLERVEYDEAGRRVRVINGNDESTRYVYDRAGNVVYTGQEAGLRPVDGQGLPASHVLKYGFVYAYDALGRKVEQSDANGLTQTWTYNTLGRLTGHGDKNGAVQYNYAYNLAGQLTHEGNNAGLKKDIGYQYDGAGQLIRIQDNFLGQTTSYSYDLTGNRLSERVTQKTKLASGDYANVVYQDNRLFYDAQNRLRAVLDGRVDVRIDYDLAGNRSSVSTKVKTQSGGTEKVNNSVTRFTYDAMNRQKGSSEYAWNGDQLGTLLETHNYVYDLAGNRIADNNVFISGGGENGSNVNGSYAYIYDDLHRMVSYSGYGIAERQTYQYDGAGRAVYTMSLVKRGSLWNEEHRYNQYAPAGKLQDTRAVLRRDDTKAKTHVDDIRYHDTTGSNAATGLGYDAAGNLRGYQQVSDGDATTTRYQYATQNGSYLQSEATTTRGGSSATSHTWRDANGFISHITETNTDGSPTFKDLRFNRAFVNDVQGNALYVNQAAGQTGRIQNGPGGYIGGWVGDSLDPGHIQRQLVANGQVLGRFGDAPDSINDADPKAVPKYVHSTDFQLEAQVLNLKGASVDPVSYTVVGGETLRDVARNVLGDGSLWWRIADANALAISADAPLTVGQTLSVPKLALNANNAETFQPYDPSKITGGMEATLPMPAQGDKCGGIGQIIMIVVAIVVTIYTAGALSAGASSFLSTMQAGTSALAGSGGLSFGGAALSAAAGSVVSQAVGIAIGAQEGFNWKAVALSALSGGIGFGLSEMGVAGSIARATNSSFLGAAGQAAIANALTQGVSVATGLQKSFDWRGVAASAVGAGVGAVVGESLGMNHPDFKTLPFGEQFGARLATGLVAGTAAAIARGGKVAVQQVAVDAFGNALGSSIAEANWGGGQQDSQGTVYNDGDIGRSELRYGAAAPAQQPEVDAVLGAFNNSTPVGVEDADLVAAAGDYNLGRARRTAMDAGPIHDEAGNGSFSGTGLKVDPSKLPRFWTSERFEPRYAPSLGWKELGEYLNPVTRLEGFANGFSFSGMVDGAVQLFTDPEGTARAMQDSTRKYFEAGRRGDFETAARFEGQFAGEQAAGLVLGYGVGRGLGFGARAFNAMGGVASDLVSSSLASSTGLRVNASAWAVAGLESAVVADTAAAGGLTSSQISQRYGSFSQRYSLLNQVAESSTLSEAKGVVYAFREMKRLGFQLEDVSLKYRGNQGLDLVFSNQGKYAIVEAKHGKYLSSLETYAGGLRQGSVDYNISRLERYVQYGDGKNVTFANRLLNDAYSGQLDSFATMYRGKSLYQLPLGWPKVPALKK
ncbi:Ig-like domain repeat protein [Acidovorax sp. LjRoot129]|uniref:Ig-like domain repeat protein n=1 Tax=Acidovorax sp. LjRoot129 TaxID=3342260 RepID=UPI003ECCA2BD